MSNIGTYEEQLSCGGTLKVTRMSWQIDYYFPDPDLRYNGTFIHVPSSAIQQYIDAFFANWQEYESLKATPQRRRVYKDRQNGYEYPYWRLQPRCMPSRLSFAD